MALHSFWCDDVLLLNNTHENFNRAQTRATPGRSLKRLNYTVHLRQFDDHPQDPRSDRSGLGAESQRTSASVFYIESAQRQFPIGGGVPYEHNWLSLALLYPYTVFAGIFSLAFDEKKRDADVVGFFPPYSQ